MLCYLKGFFRYKLFNSFKPINKFHVAALFVKYKTRKKNHLKGSVFFFFYFNYIFLVFFFYFKRVVYFLRTKDKNQKIASS